MESEIEHLTQSGSLSDDYLWKVNNAYRSIKDDAEWCEKRSIFTLPDRLLSDANQKTGTARFMALGMIWIVFGGVGLGGYLLISLIAAPIMMSLLKLSFYLGMKESYSTDEMASFEFLFSIILYFGFFMGAYIIGFYIVRLPFWFFFGGGRFKAYKKKREVLINGLLDEGIRDFGGAKFERDLTAAVSLLEDPSRGVSQFVYDLKVNLDSGHIAQKMGGIDEANFYSKGYKERIGGMLAVSTLWLVIILIVVTLVSAILFFLWRRFFN